MSKEAYYFSHDANARHDPKILAMRSECGIQGYGVYWVIIEMLRESEDFKLPMKKLTFNAIAMQVLCKDYAKDDAKSFVENCIKEYELFETDGEFFWSKSLLKRMDKKNDVSEKRRAAAKKRWDKANSEDVDANAMQNDANAMQTDAIKGKEIKRNKNNNTTSEPALNDTAKIIQFWDDNGFGFNNINAKDRLLDWLDEPKFKEAGPMILRALEIATGANKRVLNYVEGILKNWLNASCVTLADADAHQSNFNKGGSANKKVDWEALA